MSIGTTIGSSNARRETARRNPSIAKNGLDAAVDAGLESPDRRHPEQTTNRYER